MKTVKISFFFTEMRREKGKILIFHVIFLNKDISIIVADITLKICISVLHTIPEGSLSLIFYLGPRFFILCDLENNVLKISKKLTSIYFPFRLKKDLSNMTYNTDKAFHKVSNRRL